MIEVKFWLKGPQALQTVGYYKFTEEEFKKLLNAFQTSSSSTMASAKAGVFECMRGEHNEKLSICVRWDEVVFIG